MYTGLLSYVKSALVSHGISMTNLCLQRFLVLLILEFFRQILFPSCFQDDATTVRGPNGIDSSINQRRELRQSSNLTVATIYFIQGALMTVSVMGVLIGAQLLPLSQLVIILHASSFVITKVNSLIWQT